MKIIKKLLILLTLVLIIKSICAKDDELKQCQYGKSLRKQVKPALLDGMCLKDIIIRLSKFLRSMGNNELGLTEYQEILDKLDFINIPDEPDIALNNLADSINIKLEDYLNILEESLKTILPIINDYKDNDSYNDNKFIKLNKKVNTIDICDMIGIELYPKLSDNRLKNLHIIPLLKHPIKICGPTGSLRNIGSLFLSQCDRPKNVIVLMEHGAFMSDNDIILARKTAKTIVDMLSDSDSVTVIGLAGRGFIHCKNGLIKSTDINKLQLINRIDNTPKLNSNETLNIDFDELTKNLNDDIVIVHVTNTLKDISNVTKIISTIKTKNLKIHLRTVLILSDLKKHIEIEETSVNGNIITLPSNNILGYDIARLFSTLDCPTFYKKDYYLSDIFFDQYTKTISLSITRMTDIALISLNIKLHELVQDVTYFNAGSFTYAILFDKKGIVLMHKNFPRTEMLQEQPLKVYLRDIENIDDNNVVEMVSKPEGNMKLINKLGKNITIKWKHLKYLDLITCIIIEDHNITRPVVKFPPSLANDIYHHRLDLISKSSTIKSELCINRGSIMSPMHSVIYLSPWCLKSTIEDSEISVTLPSYMAYIKDSTELVANPGLGATVRQDVATLAQTLNYFKQRHTESPGNKFILRRYVTSVESGVVEIYPGTSLDSSLDPKRRLWFTKSLEYPGKIILTGPYLDAGGSGYVVTLSQTISEGRRAALHGNHDPIIAISSMDMTVGYIARLLREMLPFCNESTIKCFLMDDRGYLISHPTLFEPGLSKIEQQHLTHKELLVANDILNHEMFVKKKLCANHMDGTAQRYYQFNTSLDHVLTNIIHGEHCVKYQLAAVPGTNVFFGVINETCSLNAFCPCSTMDRVCLNCKRMEQTECECPCECSLYTDGCEKSSTSGILEPCPAPFEQGIQSTINGFIKLTNEHEHQSSLDMCPKIDCKIYETESECLGIIDCQWCLFDTDGEIQLNTPFCTDISLCFRGILGSPLPYSESSYNSQSIGEITNHDWPSVGPIAAGILIIILLFGITLFCYRLHNVQTGVEHQCLHLHGSPDTLRMTHLDGGNNGGIIGDQEIIDNERTKNHIDNLILMHENIPPISPYRVSTNYRRPAGGDSDHGYSTMTPHDDTEQQSFAEPLLLVGGTSEPELIGKSIIGTSVPTTTCLESPHRVLVPVTVHQNMEPNYC